MTRRPPTRRQSRMNDALHPPVNVRALGVDGTEYPVQTVYVGMEGDLQVYEIVDPPAARITNILVEVLPAKTSVVYPDFWRRV